MTDLVSRAAVAEFIERYAERRAAGPAVKERSAPVNRHRDSPDVAEAVRQSLYAIAQAVRTGVDQPENDWPKAAHTFQRGDLVEKVAGSSWRGIVVGEYGTSRTPEGYAIESMREPGSVQIYPAKALRHVEARA